MYTFYANGLVPPDRTPAILQCDTSQLRPLWVGPLQECNLAFVMCDESDMRYVLSRDEELVPGTLTCGYWHLKRVNGTVREYMSTENGKRVIWRVWEFRRSLETKNGRHGALLACAMDIDGKTTKRFRNMQL